MHAITAASIPYAVPAASTSITHARSRPLGHGRPGVLAVLRATLALSQLGLLLPFLEPNMPIRPSNPKCVKTAVALAAPASGYISMSSPPVSWPAERPHLHPPFFLAIAGVEGQLVLHWPSFLDASLRCPLYTILSHPPASLSSCGLPPPRAAPPRRRRRRRRRSPRPCPRPRPHSQPPPPPGLLLLLLLLLLRRPPGPLCPPRPPPPPLLPPPPPRSSARLAADTRLRPVPQPPVLTTTFVTC